MFSSEYSTSFKRAIIYSSAVHIVLAFLILFVPNLSLNRQYKMTKVTWVQIAKGTGESLDSRLKEAKGLPQSTIQEQQQLLEKSKSAEKKKEGMTISKKGLKTKKEVVQKKKSAEDKKIEQALAKIDKQLKHRQVQVEAAQIKDSGEGFKYGTSDTPTSISVDDPEYVKYQLEVRYKIMKEWVIPEKYTADENLRCKYTVIINDDGEVISYTLTESSNNASFDASAVRAITRASPLPIPPEKLKEIAYEDGFEIDFVPPSS